MERRGFFQRWLRRALRPVVTEIVREDGDRLLDQLVRLRLALGPARCDCAAEQEAPEARGAEQKRHRKPSFWGDVEVRRALAALHRETTLSEARAQISARFGPERAPSRSAIGRFWKSLD